MKVLVTQSIEPDFTYVINMFFTKIILIVILEYKPTQL
jgi:hypothetical protein